MGVWDARAFGNDDALDWLAELRAGNGSSDLIVSTIDAVLSSQDEQDWQAEEAIAAAAVIAAAASDPVRRLPSEAKAWVESSAFVPDKPLIQKAIAALEKISQSSELKDLWEESGSIGAWVKEVGGIVSKLRDAIASELPQRRKKRQAPRVLWKMVEAFSLNPNDELRARIDRKVCDLPDVNAPSMESFHEPPLCLVAKHPLPDAVRQLLERGADPNVVNIVSQSPLALACGSGNLSVARILVQFGATVIEEILIDERTGTPIDHITDQSGVVLIPFRYSQALFAAARSGNADTIDYLVGLGADLHQIDLNGETLLHKSCEQGNLATTQHLMKLGLDINKGKLASGETPIHYSVRSKQMSVTELILKAGANPNSIDEGRQGNHHWVIAPLDIALDCEDTRMIALLRKHGALSVREIGNPDHKLNQ